VRKITLAATLLLVGFSAARAQMMTVPSPTPGDSLPKKGTATYTGTWTLNSSVTVGAGMSGPITIYVDFASGAVSATLTIPAINPGTVGALPQTTFTPSGVIARSEPPMYTITQGALFGGQAYPSFISLSGSFQGPRGGDTAGTFSGDIEAPAEPGVYGDLAGTFSATAQ
jgi:hypothetical protein